MFHFVTRDPSYQQWSTLIYVMLGRLMLLIVLLLLLTLVMHFNPEDNSFYVFVAVTFVVTIAYAVWLRRDRTTKLNTSYQFSLDVLIVTGLVHFTGGINSQLGLLYPLVILSAGIVVSGRLALKMTMLATFLYATLILLEMSGVLEYRGPSPFPYTNPSQVFQMMMLRVLILVLFAAASSYLADRCFFQDKQLERLQLIATSTLDNVAVPLIAAYRNGQIMTANPAALRMLGCERETITGQSLLEFFPDATPDIGSEEDAKELWQMQRADGSSFPASFQTSRGTFPAVVVGSLADGNPEVELYLVAIRDMSDLLRAREDHNGGEQRVALGVVTEMAHVVRNPLTAIRGAGELLNVSVNTMFQNAREIRENDWQAVKSMCQIIFEQTQELDQKVGAFLESAAHNPDWLMKTLKDAEAWTAKVHPSAFHTQGEPAHGPDTDC